MSWKISIDQGRVSRKARTGWGCKGASLGPGPRDPEWAASCRKWRVAEDAGAKGDDECRVGGCMAMAATRGLCTAVVVGEIHRQNRMQGASGWC